MSSDLSRALQLESQLAARVVSPGRSAFSSLAGSKKPGKELEVRVGGQVSRKSLLGRSCVGEEVETPGKPAGFPDASSPVSGSSVSDRTVGNQTGSASACMKDASADSFESPVARAAGASASPLLGSSVRRSSGRFKLPEVPKNRDSRQVQSERPFQCGAIRLSVDSDSWVQGQSAPRWRRNPRYWSCGLHQGAGHSLDGCLQFANMPVAERFELVRAQGRCFRCLGGHWREAGKACSLARQCGVQGCRSWAHHPLLHRPGYWETPQQGSVGRYFRRSGFGSGEVFTGVTPARPKVRHQACQVELGDLPAVRKADQSCRSGVEGEHSGRSGGGSFWVGSERSTELLEQVAAKEASVGGARQLVSHLGVRTQSRVRRRRCKQCGNFGAALLVLVRLFVLLFSGGSFAKVSKVVSRLCPSPPGVRQALAALLSTLSKVRLSKRQLRSRNRFKHFSWSSKKVNRNRVKPGARAEEAAASEVSVEHVSGSQAASKDDPVLPQTLGSSRQQQSAADNSHQWAVGNSHRQGKMEQANIGVSSQKGSQRCIAKGESSSGESSERTPKLAAVHLQNEAATQGVSQPGIGHPV